MQGAAGLVAAVWLLALGCIYDPNQRCGPAQHLSDNSTCACDDGFVLVGEICAPCPTHEVWEAGVCVCVDGYTRQQGSGLCVKGGAGTRCDPAGAATDCTDARFPTCRARGTAGLGYCTKTCGTDSDCPHGFACDNAAKPPTCKSAAVGEGDPCSSGDDCKGKDASYCEVALLQQCIVPGCAVSNPLTCSEGYVCCDVRSLGLNLTLCVPEGMCPTAR